MSDIFGGETFAEQTEYLRSRGIDDLTAKRLGLEVVGPTRLKELDFKHKAGVQRAILFPIYSLGGETAGYGARLFYQKTFGKDSRAKFLHPPSVSARPPSLYFSPLANWEYLEYGQRVLICESYIKANIAAKLGFHAIGVSGCWGWSHNQELHWAMQELDWRGKRLVPVLCMDSDVHTESVKLSGVIKHFQAKCEAVLGVKAEMLTLPDGPEGKWGLDDYYMANGESATREFLGQEAEPIASELDAHLAQMNNEVCVIGDLGRFVSIDRGTLMGRGQFEDINYATRSSFNAEGKATKVAKVWTQWNKRNEVDTLKYKPGKERIVRKDSEESYFNEWKGWGSVPIAGDSGYFTDWLDDSFSGDLERNYFVNWWSYQLQHPGVKLNNALMLVGPSGVGKGWMASIAERIFGSDNTWKCNLSDLESNFNSGLGAAQLMVVEEADVAGSVKIYNVLKDLITNEHIRWERKGVDAIKIDNCLNVFLNSNHIDVLQLDEFDRRFAVLEITNQSIANDASYWDPRWRWLEEEGGASIIMGYLLARDLTGFNPKGEAPWSQAKSDMVESTHHPMDRWVNDHVLRGEEMVVGGTTLDCTLMSAKELAWCYHEGRIAYGDVDRRQSMAMYKAVTNA